MAYETFSKRKKRLENSGKQDVFVYDYAPDAFRAQIVHIMNDAIGPYSNYSGTKNNNDTWKSIEKVLLKELGLYSLGTSANPPLNCVGLIKTARIETLLDVIEIIFLHIDHLKKWADYQRRGCGISQDPQAAIDELNRRFYENAMGYQFQNSELVRVDSQLIHEEVVKSALTLINEEGFEGAEDEFRNAYEHYRHGRNKDAISDALKAFESVLKTICSGRGWNYGPKDTAKTLLDILFKNDFIKPELATHFSGVRSALEAGVPTIRNKLTGHGQGEEVVSVPEYMVSFVLHSAAAAIVFLVKIHRSI